MRISSVDEFISYYDRIKARTIRLFDYIPEEQIEWTYQEGKFTLGDLIRHNACIERFMYAETIRGKPSSYAGCGESYAKGLNGVIDFYKQLYQESRTIFLGLDEDGLNKKM
ncbi:MAG: hypothetical protein R3B47_09595 [Bacteroidia bacterium]